MKINKVKRDNKTNVIDTIKHNFAPRVPKQERKTLKQIIEQRKNAERNARLVKLF